MRFLGICLLVLCAALVQAADVPALHLGMSEISAGTRLPVTVFYPTLADEQPVQRGQFKFLLAPDAEPAALNGRLIVISHGSAGSPWVHVDLARALAMHGFVVAIPLHEHDNYLDTSEPGPPSWDKRPREISQTIDALAAQPRFAGALDWQQVGIFGGSAGGHTVLTLAGGQWSNLRFRDHCLEQSEQDFSACVGTITRLKQDGLDGFKLALTRGIIRLLFSDATVRQYQDRRIRAAVAMVPYAADFDPASLANPSVALGLVMAEQDIFLRPQFHVAPVLAACQPRCTLIMTLEKAGHGAMLSPLPSFAAGSVEAQLLADPPGFDRKALLPVLQEKIADFFMRKLGVAASAPASADQASGF